MTAEVSTFVRYPSVDRHVRSWTVTPGRSGKQDFELAVTANRSERDPA